jgi:hypothetical protein
VAAASPSAIVAMMAGSPALQKKASPTGSVSSGL